MKNIKILKKLVIILLLALMIYSSFNIINYFANEFETNKNILKNKEILDEQLTINSKNNNIQNSEKVLNLFKKEYSNDDIFSIIEIPGTNIKFPVAQSEDNEFYLDHDLNKKPNLMGTIFLDYENSNKLTDNNSIIYGHNIKNGFNELNKFLKQNYLLEYNKIYIYLFDETKEYEIISVYITYTEDDYINPNIEKNSFIETILEKSQVKKINYVNKENNILTLSTCANKGEKRLVLHAIEI